MIYRLQIWSSGQGPGVEVTAEEYAAIKAAQRRILLATDIEERLDLLLENFVEYELELLELGLRRSLFSSRDLVAVVGELQVLNRRTMNLLAAARSYIDQLKHAISQYFSQDQAKCTEVRALLSAEYDNHFEYRVAEELRNYTHHRSLPIDSVSWTAEWGDGCSWDSAAILGRASYFSRAASR